MASWWHRVNASFLILGPYSQSCPYLVTYSEFTTSLQENVKTSVWRSPESMYGQTRPKTFNHSVRVLFQVRLSNAKKFKRMLNCQNMWEPRLSWDGEFLFTVDHTSQQGAKLWPLINRIGSVWVSTHARGQCTTGAALRSISGLEPGTMGTNHVKSMKISWPELRADKCCSYCICVTCLILSAFARNMIFATCLHIRIYTYIMIKDR